MWLCFLSEHSLFPGGRNLSLTKLAFFSPASNSRSAKGKLFFINSVPQNNLKLATMRVHPQRSRLPNVKPELLIQFPSLWSKSAVFHFLWNCKCRKMLKQESPATSKRAPHSSLFQPRDLSAACSGSPESVNRIQRPGLSVQLTTSPSGWLPMGKSGLGFFPSCKVFQIFLSNWLQKSQSYLYPVCICVYGVPYIFLSSCQVVIRFTITIIFCCF